MISKAHCFFLLAPSPWPLVVSVGAFNLLFSSLLLLKFGTAYMIYFNILNISVVSYLWWVGYGGEFNLQGMNSSTLETGVKTAMIFFISSEIFFFFSFFWSYFHFFLSPTLETGMLWPPFSVEMFDCLNVPLTNTLILMSSGVTVTMSHHFLLEGEFKLSSFFLALTIFLGVMFTYFQYEEYQSSFFTLSDSSFGTSFFMLTGFHGIHVIIGSLFLVTTLVRFNKFCSSKSECLSFELASWYWHFVDVVWIFLYFIIYYLNN
uniref:Cytochrome c oxidase subunit 3 n=1 Tax=Phyllocoptes taishanensis TaxID=1638174 RepID=A0A0U2Q6M7_9ACAR|nr:cytochrome c oxidase subunit III [Phyllocoptes taishanensis]ALK03800.1 cytochrome oxidase subunit 3 [Phyllocoptes taishanensis]